MDTQSYRIDDEVASQTPDGNTLTYEETPIMENENQGTPDMYPPPKPQNNTASIVTAIIAFILLFIVGFWLSGSIRKYIGSLVTSGKQETATVTTTPTLASLASAPTQKDASANTVWKTYPVLQGATRVPYEGISFKLPPEVLSPICDGSACGSQGTYLPGGTRFTVAIRGEGQVLPDFRGKIISDLKGIPFPLKEVSLVGRTVTEFTGGFTGTTVGGYVFTQMHGYMIPITDTLSFEINHFTPNGITTDFAKDEILFGQILQTLVIPGGVAEKGVQSVSPTGIITSTPIANVSPTIKPTGKTSQEELCSKNGTTSAMTYADALSLVNKSQCVGEGKILSTRTCNTTTGVWWIDIEKVGSMCKNVCEVDVVTKVAKFIANCPL
jgi:hypothetical protein